MTVITVFYLYKAHFSMLVYIFYVEYWVILYGTIHSRLTWLFIQCAKLFLPSMSIECDTDIMISQLVNLNNCSVTRGVLLTQSAIKQGRRGLRDFPTFCHHQQLSSLITVFFTNCNDHQQSSSRTLMINYFNFQWHSS